MKQKGKISTIVDAFTEEPTIDQKTWDERKESCRTCPYNSNNIPEEELGLYYKTVRASGKAACTLCKCFIDKKTSQETEECALPMIGKPARWNRLKLELTSKGDLNIINHSPDKVGIRLTQNNSAYAIHFGVIDPKEEHSIEFDLESNEKSLFKITRFVPSCGSCTKKELKRFDSKTYKAKITLSLYGIKPGSDFKKFIHFDYTLGNRVYKNIIHLIGKIKEEDNGKS